MKDTSHHGEKIAKMSFSSVYPHYVHKIVHKGRSVDELHMVITWLTGFEVDEIQDKIRSQCSFEEFFATANLNPKASLITGVICGYRVEEIVNRLTRNVRYLDKLVDELAKGKKMEKIMRST